MNAPGTTPTPKREEPNRIQYRAWFSNDGHKADPIEAGVLAMVCEVINNDHTIVSGHSSRPISAILPLRSFADLKASQVWLDMKSEALSEAEAALDRLPLAVAV